MYVLHIYNNAYASKYPSSVLFSAKRATASLSVFKVSVTKEGLDKVLNDQ